MSLIAGVMACMSAGCLAPGPPDFEQPAQLGPFFLLAEAVPPTSEISDIRPDERFTFKVPFRSEDAGEQLFGARHRNLGREDEEDLGLTNPFEPSSLDDTRERTFEFTWTPKPGLRGCHSITLFLTHRTNMNFAAQKPFDEERAASVSWWNRVGDPGELFFVEECGTSDQNSATGGGT